MTTAPWVLITILVALILIGILVAVIATKRKKRYPPDYYTFFIIGFIWLIFGVVTDNFAFLTIGLIFAIIGLVNKKKWRKNRIDWKKMNKQERKLIIWIMIILGTLVFAGVVVLLLIKSGGI